MRQKEGQMITHIFKDGTTKENLENVYVPKELMEAVVSIARTERTQNECKFEKRIDRDGVGGAGINSGNP
jgi:hypothetical protein